MSYFKNSYVAICGVIAFSFLASNCSFQKLDSMLDQYKVKPEDKAYIPSAHSSSQLAKPTGVRLAQIGSNGNIGAAPCLEKTLNNLSRYPYQSNCTGILDSVVLKVGPLSLKWRQGKFQDSPYGSGFELLHTRLVREEFTDNLYIIQGDAVLGRFTNQGMPFLGGQTSGRVIGNKYVHRDGSYLEFSSQETNRSRSLIKSGNQLGRSVEYDFNDSKHSYL